MKKKLVRSAIMVLVPVVSVLLLSGCWLFDFTSSGSPTITISPNTVTNGQIGKTYKFTVTAKNIPSGTKKVTFDYSFGDGSANATGSEEATVSGGKASIEISHSYSANSAYGLTVAVSDDTDILATGYASVLIGTQSAGRNYTLTKADYDADAWVAANSGGYGITVDKWDISALPKGCKFDLSFNAQSVPDKYIIEYPDGTIVLDTGWRGDSSYAGPLYPGGIVGVGAGEEDDIFTKGSQSYFKVTIIGPDPGTAWGYSMRAHK